MGLLNALDTAHEPHSQEYSLLGTGPGSLQPMPTQSADEWESSFSVTGSKNLQGLIELFPLSSRNQLELELRPRLSSVLRTCPKGALVGSPHSLFIHSSCSCDTSCNFYPQSSLQD